MKNGRYTMKCSLFTALLLLTLLVDSVSPQDAAGSLLDFILNSQRSPTPKVAQRCVPYALPSGYKTFQDYCKNLSIADDQLWDAKYKTAAAPTFGQPFPLKGCVLGCIVGKDSFQRASRWGAGAWSGKCIRNAADVVNLLTPLPSFGGLFNVLDSLNWTSFLPVVEQYPGSIQVGPSWWDAFYTMPTTGTLNKAWTITYEDVQTPELNANSTVLEQTSAMYAQLVRGSRDEIRSIGPGAVLGQVFRMPNSYLNPTPFPVNTGIRFILFQVCDRRGNYAVGGNVRYLKT